MPPTLVNPNDINTRQLFSVKQILLSRGFEVINEDTSEKLLITEENIYDAIWVKIFNVFNDYGFRTELKNFLYNQNEVTSIEVKEIVTHPKFVRERSRFDNTFEWFAGELMIKKFAAFSASFGVTIRDIMRNTTATSAGDYDSLVVLRNTNLAYFECKAGGFDNSAIMKCYERMLSLNCEYSILICVKNIEEEQIIWECSKVIVPVTNGHDFNKIYIKGRELDIIYDLHNCYIIDLSRNFENKIRTILRVNAAKINQLHYGMSFDNDTFNKLGYEVQTLDSKHY
ncbi:MAG: hypothetical protein NTZ69_17905 [Bacteroidia bacterium]|nr:hypothetical protein [Bacteroidia bacterium]